jgi:hypothetical protein
VAVKESLEFVVALNFVSSVNREHAKAIRTFAKHPSPVGHCDNANNNLFCH